MDKIRAVFNWSGGKDSACYDGLISHSPVPYNLEEPFSRNYDIHLDDGMTKTYTYWFADLKE